MARKLKGAAALVAGIAAAVLAAPAAAQTLPIDPYAVPDPGSQPTVDQNEGLRETGRTAQTGNGEVGQRQQRGQAAANIRPLGRVSTRISNRVQNRLRNRIDRGYDPTANATAPFEAAEERTRTTPR